LRWLWQMYYNTYIIYKHFFDKTNNLSNDTLNLCFSTNGVPYFSAVYKQLEKLVRMQVRKMFLVNGIIKETYIKQFSLVILQRCRVKDTLSHNTSLFFIHCVVKLDVLCLALNALFETSIVLTKIKKISQNLFYNFFFFKAVIWERKH